MGTPVNLSFTDTTATADWEHALISGNGRQGALCYGTPAGLRFTLAHEDLVQPVTDPLPAPATHAALPALRDLLGAGLFGEAAQAVCDLAVREDQGYGETRWIDPLIGAGTLVLTPASPAAGYQRGTDFTTGVVRQEWTGATCDAFVSGPADVLVVRLTGSDGTVRIGPVDGEPERPVSTTVERAGDDLVLTGRFLNTGRAGALEGWTVAVRVTRTPGSVLIVARVAPGLRTAAEALAALPAGDSDEFLDAHAGAHADLFGRVRLDLGGHRAERLFDAGRYAIISSTGRRPPTLQGVWSGTWSPPWRSGWTIDGNLQAALLAVHSTGTPELMRPVFDLVDDLRDDFRENARRLYGLPGIYVPAHLGTHGRQNHFGPTWCLTFWTAGAAWLGRLYLDHWQHTGDGDFLTNRALPYLREAAEFYAGFVQIVDGRAHFSPSYSPENHPSNTGAQACTDATMDVQAVAGLLRALIAAGDPDPRWPALLAALPPYRINDDGELAEWLDPRLADNHEHRHCSHFYPFWYAGDPAIADDPALRAAAVAAVRARLAWWLSAASDEMGHGLALLGVAAAHLGLATEAYAALRRIMEAYWRPSLVPTHNRDHMFNVDLAGGLPALVVAMLLRSRDVGPDGIARIDLLPALPPAWPTGRVTGLIARGPVRVDMSWSPSGLEATLTSPADRTVELTTPAGSRTLHLRAAHPTTHRPPNGDLG